MTGGWYWHPPRLEFHTGSGPAFAAPIGEVGPVTWPWWWFGGGLAADRPWGHRTLHVADPDGFVVEFAQEIPRARGRAT